ncbi:hypothetical protein GWI33_005780 [Rhynchophorus ferrugineus]|uniref:Uncharacterized protein n=1 Tax=Rhynchophorus ferrugineus TaxID=354439 RepID=A0A834ITS9_RHYFE|nr:hypothetical protein GWI33_005780 [Rhynchophorus ferrugineus]
MYETKLRSAIVFGGLNHEINMEKDNRLPRVARTKVRIPGLFRDSKSGWPNNQNCSSAATDSLIRNPREETGHKDALEALSNSNYKKAETACYF